MIAPRAQTSWGGPARLGDRHCSGGCQYSLPPSFDSLKLRLASLAAMPKSQIWMSGKGSDGVVDDGVDALAAAAAAVVGVLLSELAGETLYC